MDYKTLTKEENQMMLTKLDALSGTEMDAFAGMVKGHTGRKIKSSFLHIPKPNDDFFFWIEFHYACKLGVIQNDGTNGTSDYFGVARKIIEDFSENIEMILKLDNGNYRYYSNYSNNTYEDFVNPIDAMMKLMR